MIKHHLFKSTLALFSRLRVVSNTRNSRLALFPLALDLVLVLLVVASLRPSLLGSGAEPSRLPDGDYSFLNDHSTHVMRKTGSTVYAAINLGGDVSCVKGQITKQMLFINSSDYDGEREIPIDDLPKIYHGHSGSGPFSEMEDKCLNIGFF